MDHVHRSENVELIKAGAGLNCDQSPGGMLFEDWQSSEGIRVPTKLKLVRHLNELVQRDYQLKNVSVTKYDDETFQLPVQEQE